MFIIQSGIDIKNLFFQTKKYELKDNFSQTENSFENASCQTENNLESVSVQTELVEKIINNNPSS